ncbi:aryl-sulfate sulfotransferase [Tenacibaculum sp. HL-MS23]|uniref:aryl-sulfate sulfotransferase n=1 Tax=Tenacibaculum sp. HL-MS23 TaxID=3077734 RepID=UPI0028FC1C00|nr:aryl-sulfate sulfotransferase [Tenacibaculum sp. HL-MS23]WNW00642.1 aryl-sulfate sulfotransferase [Tenacibaculum sp. HL-MS23]
MKKLLGCCFFLCVIYSCGKSEDQQEDVLLTSNIEVYEEGLIDDSLVLAVENGADKSYLLDKAGNKIKTWDFDLKLGNDLEIMSDGKLLGMFKVDDPAFSFGGGGGIIRILNIDGSVDWEYKYATENHLAHHDVEMLPNGNIIFLAWERITKSEAKLNGVETEGDIFPEVLVEVNPNTNTIVWEWHSFDHIIQDKLPSSTLTYGVLSENPQNININYYSIDNGDIMHANGIDYDAEKDVIYISVNYYGEVWVVDHSTTLLEAKTSLGGNYGKGGDLLYRFGNPKAYNSVFGERMFSRNHFPNFLEKNIPGAGNVLVYMNGNDVGQSTVYELKMPEVFELKTEESNEPNVVWSFTDSELFYGKISGATRLKNGNTLICEGDYGFWEITPEKEVAWKYNGGKVSFWRGYPYTWDSPEIKSLKLKK